MKERQATNHRHDPITDKLESLHPIGQPISISAKRGFKIRSDGEEGAPSVEVVSSGGPQRKSVASAVR